VKPFCIVSLVAAVCRALKSTGARFEHFSTII